MGSLFKNTYNTRSILPDGFRFIRSDVPNRITEKEVQWLIDHNVTTVIDLRDDKEREQKKCQLIKNKRFQYYCMHVTGGNSIPKSVDDVSKSYLKMADEQMDKIVNTISKSEANVLYFCNAGKDRTGVVSAILLYKMGMSLDYIIKDYMDSKNNLKNILEEYAKQFPDINIDIIMPHERYIQEFLESYIAINNSIDSAQITEGS